MLRWILFATLSLATAIGSSRATGWQTGTFRIESADDEGWNAFGVSASRRSPGYQSENPLSEIVLLDISSNGGSYRAAITGLLADRSVSYEEVFPWLRDVPSQVRFRVKGETIYFLDSKNKQHKADIVQPPQRHSPRKRKVAN